MHLHVIHLDLMPLCVIHLLITCVGYLHVMHLLITHVGHLHVMHLLTIRMGHRCLMSACESTHMPLCITADWQRE